jgi:hypothetical protein
MCPVVSFLRIILFSATMPALITAEDLAAGKFYCAFHVVVKSHSGAPLPRVDVEAIADGRTIARARTGGSGLAKLCDAPLGLIDIAVGNTRCGYSVVKFVRATWPRTTRLVVTYNNTLDDAACAGTTFGSFPTDCQVLLRVHDAEGKPIPGARFDLGPAVSKRTSDALGRIFFSLRAGTRVVGSLEAAARSSEKIALACDPDLTPLIERSVSLAAFQGATSAPAAREVAPTKRR